ncbi:hypothetical protein ACH42_00715 [Endozoicomonas sp. (ex Bugula neritina AB1)]|nr:hypothetical protein ACH42_00715 [Endozoicomonas sp. (ex Bugula neritina AB1)]
MDRLVFKEVFRQAAQHGLLELEETQRWLEYRENRNNTAHDYGKKFAEQTLTNFRVKPRPIGRGYKRPARRGLGMRFSQMYKAPVK